MAKATPETESVAADPEVSLQEFCARLSETVRRPELIGAFHHRATAEGTTRATFADFKAKFEAFVNTPV